jgi:hypothetical protein
MFEECKVELLETFGDDLTVVNAARVSLGKHTDEFTEKDGKLIKYLALHEHTSPFFHPQARFRPVMPPSPGSRRAEGDPHSCGSGCRAVKK